MSNLNKTQRTILLMMVIFAIPYALSWLLYANPGWFNLGTRNNGTLISPVISGQKVHFQQLDDQPYQLDAAAEKWTLIMFGASQCGASCEKTLFTLQQLRKMMGLDKVKFRRAYVILDPDAQEDLEDLTAQIAKFPGTALQTVAPESQAFLEQTLELKRGALSQKILIADPSGNLVMWYPQDMDPKKIFADIEILFGRVKGA